MDHQQIEAFVAEGLDRHGALAEAVALVAPACQPGTFERRGFPVVFRQGDAH